MNYDGYCDGGAGLWTSDLYVMCFVDGGCVLWMMDVYVIDYG
jgi:hypothetical protein